MKRHAIDCDLCSSKDIEKDCMTFSLVVGYDPCPAGGSSIPECKKFDVCLVCQKQVIKLLLKIIRDDTLPGYEVSMNKKIVSELLKIKNIKL
jgi:hypothetical protein